jgi:hypothetical protein
MRWAANVSRILSLQVLQSLRLEGAPQGSQHGFELAFHDGAPSAIERSEEWEDSA